MRKSVCVSKLSSSSVPSLYQSVSPSVCQFFRSPICPSNKKWTSFAICLSLTPLASVCVCLLSESGDIYRSVHKKKPVTRILTVPHYVSLSAFDWKKKLSEREKYRKKIKLTSKIDLLLSGGSYPTLVSASNTACVRADLSIRLLFGEDSHLRISNYKTKNTSYCKWQLTVALRDKILHNFGKKIGKPKLWRKEGSSLKGFKVLGHFLNHWCKEWKESWRYSRN